MFGRRGITPIIATILVVMMTVAAAGAMFFWLTKIQATGQGAVEESQTMLLERMSACATIPTFNYNNYDNKSNMDIQNCGNTMLTLGDGDDNALIASNSCSFNLDCGIIEGDCPLVIGPGGFKTAILDLEEADCGSNTTAADILADQEGIQHQFILTIGTSGSATTTTARSFVPRYNFEELCSVDLSSPVDQTVSGTQNCYTYTLTNNGNTDYAFTISKINGTCSSDFHPFPYVCTGAVGLVSLTTPSIPPSGIYNFVLEHHHGGVVPCIINIQAVATAIPACMDIDETITIP